MIDGHPRPEPGADNDHRREARALGQVLDEAFEAGDYRQVRELARKIGTLAPESESAREARSAARGLRLDSVAFYSGLLGAVLYVVGWLISVW